MAVYWERDKGKVVELPAALISGVVDFQEPRVDRGYVVPFTRLSKRRSPSAWPNTMSLSPSASWRC